MQQHEGIGRVVPFGVKKCVEDAKIWTPRAGWHGRWGSQCGFIEHKNGVYHAVVNRQPTLEGKKPYHLCVGGGGGV